MTPTAGAKAATPTAVLKARLGAERVVWLGEGLCEDRDTDGHVDTICAFTAPGRLLGLHAFTKILIGYILATLGARTVVEKPLAVGVLLAGASIFESGVLVLLLWMLRGEPLPPDPATLALRAGTTGALGALLHYGSRVNWRARREARRRRRLS